MTIVQAQNLTRIYQRGREDVGALNDVSFEIQCGEFVAIVGPSGSGKTTLLNLLDCMDTPPAGSLQLMGREITGLSDSQRTLLRREKIGFVFQHFGLIPTLSVEENIALPALFARRAGQTATRARVGELLETVGLGTRRTHRPHELSGGEMQRVAIARALINEPQLLLADEPTGNLDTVTGQSIIALFQQLVTSVLTVVVVTHNTDLAAVAHRQLALRDGRLKE